MKVRLTKIAGSPNPTVETGTWDSYVPGLLNPKSLPVDYRLEGILAAPLAIGSPIVVIRTCRNGIVRPGLFVSSPVTRIEKDTVHTRNSIYRIEVMSS